MNNIKMDVQLSKIMPNKFRNWLHSNRYRFNVLWRWKAISKLAKDEIGYSVVYSQLYKSYFALVNTAKYAKEAAANTTKVVWWCWLQGEDSAPPICRACLNSLRTYLAGYEIKVITEKNMFEYIHPPQFVVEKYRNGIIGKTHFSDILRTLLLVEHGGVWIDSTVLCTGYSTNLFSYPLFAFQNWKFNIPQVMVSSSWLISASKGHPILCATWDLLCMYWERNNSLCHYFIFHMFFQMASEHYANLWKEVPRYSNIPPHILQFELFEQYTSERYEQIKSMSNFHKLTWKAKELSEDVEGTFAKKILEDYL